MVLLQPIGPLTGEEIPRKVRLRADFELAAALGAARRRVLLLDFAPAEEGEEGAPGIPTSPEAPGLWQALRGEATVAEIAVRERKQGFIYLPPGPPSGEPPRPEGAELRRLRLLLERTRAGGATTLLRGLAGARGLADLADGVVTIEFPSADRSPSPPSRGVEPDFRPRTGAPAAALPVLARFPVPPPRRTLVASGRYAPGATAEAAETESPAVPAPPAEGRAGARRVPRTGRPRSGRRPARPTRPPRSSRRRPSRPRRKPAARRVRAAPSAARPAPLGPFALIACLALLGFGLASLLPPDEAGEDGTAERELAERARLLDPPRRVTGEAAGEATGSLEAGIPDPLPFSTFSIGTALWADPSGVGAAEGTDRDRPGGGRR